MKECEKQLENASPLSSDDDSISTFKGDISEGISISQNTRKPQKHVPLCWKDQFQKAEVKMYQSIAIIVKLFVVLYFFSAISAAQHDKDSWKGRNKVT